MYTQLDLARGIVKGRIRTEQEASQLRVVELSRPRRSGRRRAL